MSTRNPVGIIPAVRRLQSRKDEAYSIATEIIKVEKEMYGALDFSDFAVLGT